MKHVTSLCLLFLILFTSCSRNTDLSVSSPDNSLTVTVNVKDGRPFYRLIKNDRIILDTSFVAFEFSEEPFFSNDIEITKINKRNIRESWEMAWGEQRFVDNNCNEITLRMQDTENNRYIDWIFRVFNDGIGFRYDFPEDFSGDSLRITAEKTHFNIACDPTVWWIPGDWDIYEHLYNTTKFSGINALKKVNNDALAQTYIPYNAVNTPVTMQRDDGICLAFHEADLTDYADMTLKVDTCKLSMCSELAGNWHGFKVVRALPFKTPWRVVLVTEKPEDLIASRTILNLNEPNKLGDVSWFTPTKYVGIWWDMHIGTKTWDHASGRHGATTEYAMALIDFAAGNNIGALLVEGWNTGWEHWFGDFNREGVFDFVTPYPDYDLEKVVSYGKSKGVEIIMHHETSAAPGTYARQMDTAYTLMRDLGIHAVKTGYVGKILPKGHYHHDQWMVNQYRKAVMTAAKNKIAVNAHEPIKATGLRRTYPNIISREGLRGQEFNAWSQDGGNPPEHLSIIAFTRMLAGPIDYTPGIFNIKIDPYKENNQVNTTLAHQLALYVVIYSPIQMVPDLMEHYLEKPDAFRFIRDVAVDWDETRILSAAISDHVTIARKERNGDNWFLGSITDENPRNLSIPCDFLEKGKSYIMTAYVDGKTAHWDKNPEALRIIKQTVTCGHVLELDLAAGGGCAVSFTVQE